MQCVEIRGQLLCRVRDAELALETTVEARLGACGDVEKAISLLCGSSVDGFEVVFTASDR